MDRSAQRPPPPKLHRLPKHARISKRPLLHPAIPSAHAGPSQAKTVYVSSSTKFAVVVKRVGKLLDAIDKRALGGFDLLAKGRRDGGKLAQLRGRAEHGTGRVSEEVVLKATARAIERTLSFALHFQRQPQYRVRYRTNSVGAIDDISDAPLAVHGAGGDSVGEAAGAGGDGEDAGMDLPETQIRRVSAIEVYIGLR